MAGEGSELRLMWSIRAAIRLESSAKRGRGGDARPNTDREQAIFNGAPAALIRNQTAQIRQNGVHKHALIDLAPLRRHRERRHRVQPAARE